MWIIAALAVVLMYGAWRHTSDWDDGDDDGGDDDGR